MQFRYNAVQRDGSGWQSGGPGAVGGHACGAIRGHRTASLLYFVFCIYVKFRKKHVHKLAHFYNEEGIDSKGDKSKMMNFHQPVISSAASSWRSLLKDQHHCLQVIHNIISICWYILRLPQGEGKYWYIMVNIGKYWVPVKLWQNFFCLRGVWGVLSKSKVIQSNFRYTMQPSQAHSTDNW